MENNNLEIAVIMGDGIDVGHIHLSRVPQKGEYVHLRDWLRVVDVFHCGQEGGYNVDAVCVVNRDYADRGDAVDQAATASNS